MSTIDLVNQIESLPEESKKEIEEHVQTLLTKKVQKKISMAELCGIFKGKITVSPDFDEPLEDFKEYMDK
jgi:hypothetical protein